MHADAKKDTVQEISSDSDEFFDAKDELDSDPEIQIDTTKQSDCQLVLTKETSAEIKRPHSYINADFRLGKFCLTLVYNSTDRQGITIFSSELSISFQKYD